MEFGSFSEVGTLIVAIIGVWIGLYQYYKSVIVKRLSFVLSLLNQIKMTRELIM